MNSTTADERLRAFECFHNLRILDDTWPIIRVDGRSFSRLTESRFDKPFDERFSSFMCQAAKALLVELGGLLAFTESDEISVLLPRESRLFDREVEKLVSIAAAIASGTFSVALGSAVQFDARVSVVPSRARVVDYFRWRQADAGRCALNGWAYWALRRTGRSIAQATAELAGRSVAEKNELLFANGINFNALPAWQKRGTGLYWQDYERPGWNPKESVVTTAVRRRVTVDRDLPLGEPFDRLILGLLGDEP
jgi:tRNA(His) 5'-end guanylyltransferase